MSAEKAAAGASALLSFRAENVRSFRDELCLSLEATAMAEKEFVQQVPWRDTGATVSVLPTAGVFGANASGKSNVLEAMDDMRHHILHSFRYGEPGGDMPRWPFRLEEQSAAEPSAYEVVFVLDGVMHEYGFVHNDERVIEEWAYHRPKGRAAMLFHREGDDVNFGSIDKARSRAAQDLLRPNALLLSTAATGGHPQLTSVRTWFARNMRLAHARSRAMRQAYTAQMLDDDIYRNAVLQLLWAADFGIVDVKRRKPDPDLRDRIERAARIIVGAEDEQSDGAGLNLDELESVNLLHSGREGDIELRASEESLGTLVWFGIIGPVLQALELGSMLLVDELDASLHPDLVERLVRLFQSPETNPALGQLVFNSHDPALMGDGAADRLLGRDQIWFTEKLNDGSTQLFRLADLGPRKHEAVTKRYLEGRYGARPILMDGGFADAAERVATAP